MGITALGYAIELLASLPNLIAAGVQVKGLIDSGTVAMTAMQADKRDPTPAEWDALNAQIKALRDELHKP